MNTRKQYPPDMARKLHYEFTAVKTTNNPCAMPLRRGEVDMMSHLRASGNG